MAKIQFSSEETFLQIQECRRMSEHLKEHSLDACLIRLLNWNPWNATITIGRDFDEKSFTFRETLPDGRSGICGGIIWHGPADGYGSGQGPAHAVTLEPTTGYSIHT